MSELIPKTEKRSLRYDFTAAETHDLSMQLARKNKEEQEIEKEKKAITSQFSARTNEVKSAISRLSSQVSDGFEYRDIECKIEFHKPTHGKKTLIRTDTNKVTTIEAMSQWEFNLFNQPDDEGTEKALNEGRAKLETTKEENHAKPKHNQKKAANTDQVGDMIEEQREILRGKKKSGRRK